MPTTSSQKRILIIEDDPIVREIMAAYLHAEGMATVEAGDCDAARRMMDSEPVDLVLADVTLPDGNIFEVIRQHRQFRDVPVIYVSSLGTPADRIRGLRNDGDDYMVKPVDPGELVARVQAVLRRYPSKSAPQSGNGVAATDDKRLETVIELGGWTLDLLRRELADPTGAVIRLTRAEFDLFAALVQAGGRALSRDYLHEVVSSADAATKARTVDVLVSRIRYKLSGSPRPPSIRTEHRQGYRFVPPAP